MMFQIEALRHQVAQAESEKVSAIRGSGVAISSQSDCHWNFPFLPVSPRSCVCQVGPCFGTQAQLEAENVAVMAAFSSATVLAETDKA
jgi:hypothetical protein